MKKAAILTFFLGLAAFAAADTIVQEIIARVNNSIITRSELQRTREQAANELRQQGAANVEQELGKREKDLLRDLIDQQLLIQKAQELGITGDTEVIKRLDEMRKQMGLESLEDLEKAAQQQGISFEDFKQNLRNNIVTQAVISREVGSKIQITAQETKQFYEQHKDQFNVPEQVRLSEILISTQAGKEQAQDAEQIAAAEAKAKQVLAEIQNGVAFEDVAKKYSDGPSAAQGGDLGYFKRGSMARELEDRTFAMKPGEVTDVIRTKQGFVVLKVTEHNEGGVRPLKEIEQQVQEAIYFRKLQPALRDYMTKLREQAFIDIKPGFVDSGASPNQTKPVMTTAAVEGAKEKLKRKKKFLLF
jgi:peptidyl-prolyl cis-trans isomerase SurA